MALHDTTSIQLTEQDMARFWSYVAVLSPEECWLWTKCCDTNGYGIFRVSGRRSRASRTAFYITRGIWSNKEVCHTCDNRRCCNPRHLFEASHAGNMADCIKKGRFVYSSNPFRAGEQHRLAKLTNLKVLEIRRLYATGQFSQVELARQFRVGQMTISTITQRKSWRHI